MPAQNTPQSFGTVARTFHWLTALLILTAIPLGVIANRLPYDTAEALATKAQLFSIHKTIGVAAFLIALGRIGWAMTQTRPVPLHPDRKAEVSLGDAVHWILYISLLAVPLTGWIHHAAVTGFAPILWPFGQTLPFVPQSERVAAVFAAGHWVFTKLLAAAILLHIAGAVKHHLIDRDDTLRRMWRGKVAPANPAPKLHARAPLLAALVIYAAGAGIAGLLVPPTAAPAAEAPIVAMAGNWLVTQGTLTFGVRQMGSDVQGSFGTWAADIDFDEANGTGDVSVTIDTTSMTLGSVTKQAAEPEFFDITAHPTATFAAAITPAADGYLADGTITLRGIVKPLSLPFTLTLAGDTATMAGQTTIDRRDFGMGPSYPDEASIGFAVKVEVALTATRQ